MASLDYDAKRLSSKSSLERIEEIKPYKAPNFLNHFTLIRKMLEDNFYQSVQRASIEELRDALRLLLKPHAEPVFGAAKTVEHEVAALNALKLLGYIKADADEFDLVENLRITKTKARSLLYQCALRASSNEAKIEESLRKTLSSTMVTRDRALYMIEVPDPLTMDRLRKRVRAYGYLSDGSFSGAVAKIPESALLKLIEDLIPADKIAVIKKQLSKSGLPDKSVTGALKAMLAAAGKKVAGEVGDQTAKAVGDEIENVLNDGWLILQRFIADHKSALKSTDL